MKKYYLIVTLLATAFALSGCLSPAEAPPTTEPTLQTEATIPESSAPTSPVQPSDSIPSETESTVTEPIQSVPSEPEYIPLEGWQYIDEQWYYYKNDIPHTGWLELDDGRYWFQPDGTMCIGWAEVDGMMRYFTVSGALGTGWQTMNEDQYYLTEDGTPVVGWLEQGDNKYYFTKNGTMHTGWLTLEKERYYFKEDGTMARGKLRISERETRYFTSTGKEIILVNPWNYVPGDYEPTLAYHLDYWPVAQECLEPLEQMLADCRKAGHNAVVVSSYRTNEYQAGLYQRRVQRFLDQGYSLEDAKKEAAMRVAIPGTSEHELGLALDIVDASYQKLNKDQEATPAQQWLMAHCWEYGFILRYPNDKTEQTGIIYEPWHYRYVGKELAMELFESGLCLEEYLLSLS